MKHKAPPIYVGLLLLVVGGIAIALAASENFALSLMALAVLMVGTALLWRSGESSIFFVIFIVQWLQVSIKIFQANLMGVSISELAEYGGNIEGAAYLSLFGLMFVAAGIRLGAGARREFVLQKIRSQVLSLRVDRLYILYFISFLLSFLVSFLLPHLSSIAQLLLPIIMVRWVFFFALTFIMFGRFRRINSGWFIIFFLEFIVGLGSFFSSFKTVFIFSLVAALNFFRRLSLRMFLTILLLAFGMLYLVTIWTAIKVEYRYYLSGGARQQVVVVPYGDRVVKLIQLARSVDSDSMEEAVKKVVSRVSYIDLFGAVLNHVPIAVPHADGELWIDAFTRPVMPRIFFPDKAEIDDSKRTIRYSGVWVAGQDYGTSISIGYMGEGYIDFGSYWMMAANFAYGIFLGLVYRWLAYKGSLKGLLGIGLASTCLFGALFFETSITKAIGGVVASALVFTVVRATLGRRIEVWLTGRRTNVF